MFNLQKPSFFLLPQADSAYPNLTLLLQGSCLPEPAPRAFPEPVAEAYPEALAEAFPEPLAEAFPDPLAEAACPCNGDQFDGRGLLGDVFRVLNKLLGGVLGIVFNLLNLILGEPLLGGLYGDGCKENVVGCGCGCVLDTCIKPMDSYFERLVFGLV